MSYLREQLIAQESSNKKIVDFCERVQRRDSRELLHGLSQRIVGQDVFVSALYGQTMLKISRLHRIAQGADEHTLPRLAPFFVIGATASGKSFTIETFFEELGIQLVTINTSAITTVGTYGDSFDDELSRIADIQGSFPEKPIAILWDEIDKMTASDGSPWNNPQAEILKYLEGGIYRGTCRHSRSVEESRYFTLDTSLVIDVFAGAFAGIEDIVRNRIRTQHSSFGFAASASAEPAANDLSVEALRALVTPADLGEWGLLGEFCGRLGTILSIPALGSDSLKRIVCGSPYSLQARYSSLLPARTKLVITGAAADWLAGYALKSGLGARALDHEVGTLVAHANICCLRDQLINQIIIDRPSGLDGLTLDVCTSARGLRSMRRVKKVHDRGG